MLTYKPADSDIELYQILDLQQANLPKNLTEEEKALEGFVTVEHTFSLLKEMNEVCKHTIAVAEDKVIGYALSMHPSFGEKISLLKPIIGEINKHISEKNNCLIMGQICIAKNYRAKGIFRGLYEAMSKFTPPTYLKIVTKVDATNIRSLNAHKTIGFKELDRYWIGEKEWILIVL